MRFLLNLFTLCFCPLLLCLSACAMANNSPAEESICLTLPCWPPKDSFETSYPQLSRWLICIKGGEEEQSFYTTSQSLTLSVKKNRPFCLLAQPLTLLSDGSECAFFKPAGFLYPFMHNQEKKDNQITWEAGFLAEIMKSLFCEGLANSLSPTDIEYIISSFNWKKAQDLVCKKIGESDKYFYNPWLLSKAQILEGISALSFKSTLLNASACTGLETSRLPSGIFFSSFIPENQFISQKNQFTVVKNTPVLIADGQKYGIFITYKSSKNISLEFIYLPIYIEDI